MRATYNSRKSSQCDKIIISDVKEMSILKTVYTPIYRNAYNSFAGKLPGTYCLGD
jgi:hypothetical protein